MTSSNGENKSLFDRVEMPEGVGEDLMLPEVPAEARQGLAKLGEEFARAEVEICTFNSKTLLQKQNKKERASKEISMIDIVYKIQTKGNEIGNWN